MCQYKNKSYLQRGFSITHVICNGADVGDGCSYQFVTMCIRNYELDDDIYNN